MKGFNFFIIFLLILIFINSEVPLITITKSDVKPIPCVDGYFYFNLIVNIYNSCEETKFDLYLGSPQNSKASCVLPQTNIALSNLKTVETIECKIDTTTTTINNIDISFSANTPRINGNIQIDSKSYETFTQGKLKVIKKKATCNTIPDTIVFKSEEMSLEQDFCLNKNNSENENFIIFKIKGKVDHITDEVNFYMELTEPYNKTVSCSLGTVSDLAVYSYIKCKIKNEDTLNIIQPNTNIKLQTQRMRDKIDTTIVLKIIEPSTNTILIPECKSFSKKIKVPIFYYIISLLFILF